MYRRLYCMQIMGIDMMCARHYHMQIIGCITVYGRHYCVVCKSRTMCGVQEARAECRRQNHTWSMGGMRRTQSVRGRAEEA